MKKEQLVNQFVINKLNERLKILEVNMSTDSVKDIIIKLDNKKVYNLYLGYKNGFLRLENQELNDELDEYLIQEQKQQEILLKKQEEERLERMEKERVLQEMYENKIDSFRGEYDFLSNMYECSIEYKGYKFRCSESAFQSQKDLRKVDRFVSLNGQQSKRLGKSRTEISLRPDWEKVKLGIMKEILKCKFDQHPELKEKLLQTGNRLLVEGNTWHDTYWGVCDGKGSNHLGKLLMELRDEYNR